LKSGNTLEEILKDIPEGVEFNKVSFSREREGAQVLGDPALVYFLEYPNPKYEVEYAEYLAKLHIYEQQKSLHDKLDELEREARRFK
jgi:hypothetical protein